MLTFGAYIAFVFDATLDMPLAVALVAGVLATAALGVAQELAMAADAGEEGRDAPAPPERSAWRSCCAT